jgi:hypothetical protein
MTPENHLQGDRPRDDAPSTTNQESQAITHLEPHTGIPKAEIPPRPHSYQITYKTEKDWRDRAKFWAEIAGLVFLIAYTVFSCLQWLQIRWTNRLTREALDKSNYSLEQTLAKMQGQTDQMHQLAVHAKNQADRTKDIADAADRSAKTAQASLVVVNRPWIGAIGDPVFTFDPLPSNGFKVQIPVLNSGLSPALRSTYYFELIPFGAGANLLTSNKQVEMWCHIDDEIVSKSRIPGGVVMFPKEPQTLVQAYTLTTANDLLTQPFVVAGCIVYADEFQKARPHHTRFCFESFNPMRRGEQPMFTSCNFWSSAD